MDFLTLQLAKNQIKLSGLVNVILDDKEMDFPDDNEFLTFADTFEKIKEDEIFSQKHN